MEGTIVADNPVTTPSSATPSENTTADRNTHATIKVDLSTRTGRSQAAVKSGTEAQITAQAVSVWYREHEAVKKVTMDINKGHVTAIIGPSGCGKSTFLRSINRMNDLIPGCRVTGNLSLEHVDIYNPRINVSVLRQRVGMVFQKPNPFPKSIFDNIAYGPRLKGIRNRSQLAELVEKSLRSAAIWNEVKDRLHQNALGLSGGQQQRVCIARALAIQPEVVLMDEPTSALDPQATAKIEDLIAELRGHYTIIIVTHNMQQAARVSDMTAFFCEGRLVEYNETEKIFTNPSVQETEDYITGRFG